MKVSLLIRNAPHIFGFVINGSDREKLDLKF